MYTEQILPLGFSRLKTTWWVRGNDVILQKIHIHKFSFTTSFRVHTAIHLAGFDEDVHRLNGMHSYDGWFERCILGLPVRRYVFDYRESSTTWQSCADNLFDFTRDILLPWFEKWVDISRLQTASESPLGADQKAYLARLRPNEEV